MDRYSGWTRGMTVAALMVMTTGACAQRVAPPPQVAAAPPAAQVPVAPAPQARAAPAPTAAPPARSEPAAPRVAALPPAPQPRTETPIPAAPQARVQTPAPAPPPPPAPTPVAEAPKPPPPAPTVVSRAPEQPGREFRVAELVSDDYGSTVQSNPTPDSAPDIAALSATDEPPAPPAITRPAPPPPPPVAPAPPPSGVSGVTLSALTSLFGAPEPEPEPEPEPLPEPAALPAPPVAEPIAEQVALAPEPADIPAAAAPEPEAPDSPYQGGFDDSTAYETAQLAQQPAYAPAPVPSPAAFNPNAPITVAILTPDTDSRPSIRSLAKGMAQAAALSARTLGNRQMTLRGYDTGGTPEKAQLAARQAVADGAQLIIGPLFASSANAVAPVAQSAGVPVIAFTTDQSVLRRGLYSVGYLPDAEVERMLSFAAQRGIRKIGLLSPDTPYGGIVYRNVQVAAPAYGVNVATVQPISPNFAQAAETGQRFADFYKSAPDTRGVLIATNGKPLQAIAAYLAFNDVLPSEVQYMGLGTWDDPETFREATLRGGWFPGLDPALKATFEGRYREAYGATPPPIAALAYDGVAIAGALLQRAQSTGQRPFNTQAIETPSGFSGMSGLFRFLPDGRNQRLLSILKVGRRQFEMLDPAPTTFSQRVSSATEYAQ